MEIEVSVAKEAARRADPARVARLHQLCDELETLEGDIVRSSTNDLDFHREIALATENEFWVLLFDILGGALTETRVATFSMDPRRFSIVVAAHRRIAEGIGSGDPEQAAEAMRDHLLEVKQTWDKHPEVVHVCGEDCR